MTLPETKVLRDPVHGYIHIDHPLLWGLLDTPEFQRLRRIRQLGGNFQVYHTADHSRFAHSLGVYELCRRILAEVPGIGQVLSPTEQLAALCAALLHDVGHGPFSHCFEHISHVHHEEMSSALILNPQGHIYPLLYRENPCLPQLVVDILAHQCENPLLHELISSQLDCDRMDYLLRDAYESGTSYGRFDLERILRTLRVHDGHLCVKRSGMHSIEDYIMSRYQMYWQVYLHPDAQAYELMVALFFRRYEQVRNWESITLLEPMFEPVIRLDAFIRLDDYALLTAIAQAQDHPDPILADLARRITNRQLFGWWEGLEPDEMEKLRQRLLEQGYDPAWYFHLRTIRLEEYLPYKEEQTDPIWVLDENRLIPLSACSVVAQALLAMKETRSVRVYAPK